VKFVVQVICSNTESNLYYVRRLFIIQRKQSVGPLEQPFVEVYIGK